MNKELANLLWKTKVNVEAVEDITPSKVQDILDWVNEVYNNALPDVVQKDLCNRIDRWKDFGKVEYGEHGYMISFKGL